MVVVSGGWVKNVVSYPSSGDVIVPSKMAAKAVLISRPNSHPFQERSLTLDQPVKIGRSVARARAAPNNAIFDCKVLSRNHALLWYENGKFYLQDTKSSNGTFVNNQRLSKGTEESPPREVCSGDIVQFGVDVMENARKVTHGCIVATLKLYLPDGKEAKASPSTSVVSSVGTVPLEDLYQLHQYLQEALQREQLLETKLATLQHVVESTRQASDTGWKALIDEDRLLSRVEILESQLQVYSKNFAEDKLREELKKLQEDKTQYQGTAKESLRKILQEKLEAIQKLQDIERTLSSTEDECAHLRELCGRCQQDLQELAQRYSQQLGRADELSARLQQSEEQRREATERLEQDKRELSARLQEQLEAERALQTRLEALQADGDLTQQQLAALQQHLLALQGGEERDTKHDLHTDSTGTQVDIILERIELADNSDHIETLRYQLRRSEEELKESHARLDELHLQLEESRCLEDSSVESTHRLQEQLAGLESQLEQGGAPQQANRLQVEIAKFEELLDEARSKKRLAEEKVAENQLELDCEKLKIKKAAEDITVLKQQLQTAQTQMKEKSESVSKLQVEMEWLETSADEVKLEVLQLQERLSEEQHRSSKHAEEAEKLRKQLLEAQQVAKQSRNEAEQMKDRLRVMQQEVETALDNRSQDERDSLEADNKKLRLDCQKMEEQNRQLLEANREMEGLRLRLGEIGDSNGEDFRQHRAQARSKILSLEEELVIVKECYAKCNEENRQLTRDLTTLREEYGALAKQSDVVSIYYFLPVALAIVVIMLALGQIL